MVCSEAEGNEEQGAGMAEVVRPFVCSVEILGASASAVQTGRVTSRSCQMCPSKPWSSGGAAITCHH